MPLVQTRGAASAQGFGEFSQQTAANYIEDVFSTYLYTGNGSTQTITNGIDLAGKGGLVWIKERGQADDHGLYDTVRPLKSLYSNDTAAEKTYLANYEVSAYNSNGFTVSPAYNHAVNTSTRTYCSWTFRKQAKFFDVVTYTGNGSGSGQTINHNLGSVPGCIIVKRTDTTGNWAVYHRSLTSANYSLLLNLTGAQDLTDYFLSTPTSTTFQVGSNSVVNASGGTYVAYLFAHNAGGFGTAGTDNVISCGSFTTDGSAKAVVNLGYEPQWILHKRDEAGESWRIADNMRGWQSDGTFLRLQPNTSGAEANTPSNLGPTATGFETFGNAGANATFIYMAIRRPMKVPTTGTSVFGQYAKPTSETINQITLGFTSDAMIVKNTSGGTASGAYWFDRLRGMANPSPFLISSGTAAETTQAGKQYAQSGESNYKINVGSGANSNLEYNDSTNSSIFYFMRRAPGFFDEVCYTGTGSTTTITHNLGVTPELVITKSRSQALGWVVWTTSLTSTSYWIRLDDTMAQANSPVGYGGTFSASNYTIANTGPYNALNNAGSTYVAYLFATLAGVSKVGSYTGTGTTQTINCSFTAGARFVLIKRTDSTGDWYVWDSARGIVSGNDPYLLLNSTAAEVTNTDYVDTASSGFEISSTAPAAINANGGSFIFLAIA